MWSALALLDLAPCGLFGCVVLRPRSVRRRGMRTLRKRPAAAVSKRPAAGGLHVKCAFCGKRSDACCCHTADPVRGSLNTQRFQKFLSFLASASGQRRRFLKDCLDVVLVSDWACGYLKDGGTMECALLAIIAFRHWNRTDNWACILAAFSRDGQPVSCRLDILEEVCHNCKHKAFARPCMLLHGPRDARHNAFAALRGIAAHCDFQQAASLLSTGVHCTQDYGKLLTFMDNISADFPGAFGSYRRKNMLDIWVAVGAITACAMTRFLVAPGAGTGQSLCHLYGLQSASEAELPLLLNHLYANLRKSKQYGNKSESLCTAGLTLCGWHRDSERQLHNGVWMSGLDRAIRVEEEEYLNVRNEAREMGIELYQCCERRCRTTRG